MGVILALAALGIAVLAHRRAEPDRRSVLVSLGALAGGLVAWGWRRRRDGRLGIEQGRWFLALHSASSTVRLKYTVIPCG